MDAAPPGLPRATAGTTEDAAASRQVPAPDPCSRTCDSYASGDMYLANLRSECSVTVRHAWTVETIVGFLHATSFASRAALQEHVDAFDADIRDVLLGVDPSGIFSQDVTFGAGIARR